MSKLMSELFETLGEAGTPRIIEFIHRLSMDPLTLSQREAISKYLSERSLSDVVALQDMRIMLSSGKFTGIPKEVYTKDNPFIAFRAYLQDQGDLVLRKEGYVTYAIDSPETDIRLASFAKTSDTAYFDIVISAEGYDSKTTLVFGVAVDQYLGKEPVEWLEDIVNKCKGIFDGSPVEGAARVFRDRCVEDFVDKPTRENANKVKGMFRLLREVLGLGEDTSGPLSKKVQYLVNYMFTAYVEGQKINDELMQQLVYLDDIFGFSLTSDCLVMRQMDNQLGETSVPFIIVLKDGVWVRGSSTDPAYEKVLLCERLQR